MVQIHKKLNVYNDVIGEHASNTSTKTKYLKYLIEEHASNT